MAAQACRDVVDIAGAAPARNRRVRLRRRPSASLKARKLRRKSCAGGGGKQLGVMRPATAAASSRKRAAIRRKMEALRMLVPVCGDGGAGEERRLEELLLHAAGYIVRLQMQVTVMQAMVHALNNPED
ncbi:hypothetical protein ACP70R_033634 [Stipagrostis hirtigluma subsp. patula]